MSAVSEFFEAIKAGGEAVLNAAYSQDMQHFVEHGAHEITSALFTGNGYVMYPQGDHDNGQQVESPQVEPPQQEQGMGW